MDAEVRHCQQRNILSCDQERDCSLPEATARWVRVEAAKAHLSVSAWIAELLNDTKRRSDDYDAAMERCLAVRPRRLEWIDARPPTREELNDRAGR